MAAGFSWLRPFLRFNRPSAAHVGKAQDENTESTLRVIREFNKRIAAGDLVLGISDDKHLCTGLINNLQKFGHAPGDVIFLSVTPDGDGTVIGRFMKIDGSLYGFDFDLVDLEYSKAALFERQSSMGRGYDIDTAEFLEEMAGARLIEELKTA